MNADFNIEEQVDYAIIERGAIQHLKEYEQRKQMLRKRHRLFVIIMSYSAAACVLLAACVGGKESFDAKRAGGNVDLDDYAKGGSLVVALMNEGNNKDALKQIEEQRLLTEAEASNEDEWAAYEKQELDYLEAVCLLRQGRFLSGRKALKSIIKGGGYFSEKATILLEQL